MIKINLSPSPKKAKAPKAKAAKPGAPPIKLPAIKVGALYILGIAVVVIIIALFLIIQSSKIGGLNRNINQLQTRLDELKVYVATVDSLKQREKELMALISPIKELNQNRFLIAHILDEISARIPEFTWLTMLNVSSQSIDIKGTTASNLLVAEFMNRLEESPYISNVDLTVLEKKTVEKQEMMEFTLTANVKIDLDGGTK
jgi:type IV pilus assembly protein PilN|uniref:PilN domain-containing protein n=1 Tax=candidate division WOR-3 bacterium TaxID=2052148 RepID=A0A7C6EGR7_UNCW3